MMIDSTTVHEALNLIAIECHKEKIANPIVCISRIRRALNNIEVEKAFHNSKITYAAVKEGIRHK
jgi:hypothetical protein